MYLFDGAVSVDDQLQEFVPDGVGDLVVLSVEGIVRGGSEDGLPGVDLFENSGLLEDFLHAQKFKRIIHSYAIGI